MDYSKIKQILLYNRCKRGKSGGTRLASNSIESFHLSMGKDLVVELERVPNLAQRPGPDEKLAVNKSNTTRAQTLAKPVRFLKSSTGLERLGLRIARRFSRA